MPFILWVFEVTANFKTHCLERVRWSVSLFCDLVEMCLVLFGIKILFYLHSKMHNMIPAYFVVFPTWKSCDFENFWTLHMGFFKEFYIALKHGFSFKNFSKQNQQQFSLLLYVTPHGNKKSRRSCTYM